MGRAMDVSLQPTEVRVTSQGKILLLAYGDGRCLSFHAAFLRRNSPSVTATSALPEANWSSGDKGEVAMLAIEPVGNYALRLQFDDGHDSGIYSWDYLRRLAAANDQSI
jgi:DUF971 family protein